MVAGGSGGEQGRPDRAVTLLAADVERLRRTVEKIEETANTAVRTAAGAQSDVRAQAEALAAQLTALTGQVAGLAAVGTQVAALADRVAELAAGRARNGVGEDDDQAPPAVSWFDADAEQAGTLLLELARWMYDVLSQYRLATQHLSDCWRRHPAVVDALLALRTAWCEAYRDPQARPTAGVDWHIRHLPGVVDLLREELRGCSELNHGPGGDYERSRQGRRVDPDEEHLREYAAWWAAGRGQGVEPGLPDRPGGFTPQPYESPHPGTGAQW